jgi:hypothetical protein
VHVRQPRSLHRQVVIVGLKGAPSRLAEQDDG